MWDLGSSHPIVFYFILLYPMYVESILICCSKETSTLFPSPIWDV